ncbi:DUF1542 domain-containing protein [Streptococcus suis]|uniref:DUF1542 domain-containing protein n=1 Tax=Streptococcus suis TaxID=1307 RepID=A0A9X4MW01_STRSU|nr:DUF1542 domain-containing protein [Streptococcus suis]MDG4527991.1 DUF1542 domain-containing protein [Streptococcus suis]MDG4530365.1 DUF1542 domain-containing protein [Streptococcus suis]
MNRSKKKSFDWYGMRQRFSIRKYHIGAASVLLGTTLVLGAGTIVSAETGVNGDGASNGQIVPVNNDGISDGTQPQGDNQGNNSSGVQTGNTTNSTANVQPAGDTGSASGQPVGTLRSADTGTQGDGSTNQPVDESVIKFPTQDNQTPPAGYQSVLFHPSYVKLDFEGKPGEIEITRNGKPIQVVAFWVKTGTTWGTLKKDPQFRIPKYTVDDGDFILGYDRSVGQVLRPTDFDSLDDTPIVDTWEFSPTVDYIVGDVSDGKTFEAYMNSGSYAPYQILQFHGITLNANGGTVDGKAKKAFYVAYKHVQWGDELVTKKIVVPSRDGYTFVRWQTATGEGIPTSGQIETIEFTAVWLKHPTEAVKVFNPEQLSETDKTKVADLIRSVNPDLQNSIQEITVANNGDATVRFTTGEERTISGASLVSDNSAEQRAKAKESISDAVLQKQDDIAKSQLTAKEQQDKLDKLRELQESIEEQIDGATSEDALDKIVEDGKNSIENFDLTSATKKTAAKQDLETAYNAKKDEIAKSALTAEEKAVKQAELDQAKSTADSAIDAATDDAGVARALTNGQSAISGIDTSTSAKKEQAKEDLEAAYNAKKAEIENSALTDEEKAAKQAELDQAKSTADSAIDAATDNAGVAKALEDGKTAIAGIDTNTSAKKAQAKQDLETAYNAKKDEIENSALTAEEKATKLAELDKAKEDAENAIDTATDNAGVAQELTNGKTAIAGIDTSTSAKKTQAKQDLETAYNAKKNEIENSALTAEEKVAKQAELDKAKEDAENAIVTATDNAGVDTALTNGQSAISGIDTSTSAKKDQAKEDLEAAYNAKKAEIENSALTDEEKAAKQAELDQAKSTADSAIDAATDDAGVVQALTDGKSAIAGIDTSTSAKKEQAKQELKAAADDAKASIDANDNLTDAEKQAAKKAVDDEVAKANDAIDVATKAAEVETATLAGEKAVAKEELKAAADDAKKAIDANNNLTDAEKQAAKKAVDDEVAKANEAIDAAKTADAVDAATLVGEKAVAKEDLETAYNAKKEEIAKSSLTAEEKAAKQAELDKAKADADKAIDAATDNAGVAKALEDGKSAIDAINTTTSAEKAAAKQALDEAYNAKKAEIENSALTAEEKAAKQAELDKAKEAADKAIDTATDNASVAKALEDGKATIDAINTTTSAEKAAAKKDLEAAYNAKKVEIENSALTAEEKAAKQAELDKAKADADKAIDAATDNTGVAKALEAGKAAIDAINTSTSAGIDTSTSAEKAAAKKDLEAAYNAKKAEIENSALTDEEKAAKQAELDKAKEAADKAIDVATDASGVAKALEAGKAAIDAINTTTSAEKAAAKKDLEDAYNAKKAEIENSALTAEEKAAKQAELDKAKADADKAIDAATDASGVAKALEDGKSAIDAINTSTSAGIDTSSSAKKAHKENKVLPKTGDNVGLSSVLGIAGLALLGTAIRKKRED